MTDTPSMIERMARAICQADEQNGGAPWDWYGSDKARSGYFDSARAVLAAMLEPTEAAIDIGIFKMRSGGPMSPDERVTAIWEAMIDAALAEDGK